MTPEEFRKIRIERRLSQRSFAKVICVHYRTVQRYESGELTVPEWVIKMLSLI